MEFCWTVHLPPDTMTPSSADLEGQYVCRAIGESFTERQQVWLLLLCVPGAVGAVTVTGRTRQRSNWANSNISVLCSAEPGVLICPCAEKHGLE